MINHQSPYGQIIKIDTNDYYDMSDEEIKLMEEKYASSLNSTIYFSKNFEKDDEYIIDEVNLLDLGITPEE